MNSDIEEATTPQHPSSDVYNRAVSGINVRPSVNMDDVEPMFAYSKI